MEMLAWSCRICGTGGITAEKCPTCHTFRTMTIKPVTPPDGLPLRSPAHGLFLFHPEHEKFVRVHTRHPAGRTLGYVFAGLVLALACTIAAFVGRVLPAWLETRELDHEGVITSGVIQDVRVVEGDEDAIAYFVTYRFWNDGHPYSREQRVSRDNFVIWQPGASVEVKYVPSEPHHSKLAGDNFQDAGRQWEVIGTVGVCIALLIALVVVGEYRLRAARSQREGRLLPGEIVVCGCGEDDEGNRTLSVKYAFQAPQGDEMTRYESRTANDLEGMPLPGTPVLVWYVSADNFRLM